MSKLPSALKLTTRSRLWSLPQPRQSSSIRVHHKISFHISSATGVSTNVCQHSRTCRNPRPLFNPSCSSSRNTTTIRSICHRAYTSAAESTSFADPGRPELFYHLVPPPTPFSSRVPAFALSFLPRPPPSVDSPTIIGWLPAAVEGDEQEAGLNDFKENPNFRGILHKAIRDGLREGVDDIQINGAMQTQQGWMHVNDNRNVPALGRIGDPDDILGSVRVEDGKMLPETYQPMPSYRLCTADGLTQLTEGLAQKLRTLLEERESAERASQEL